MTLATKLLACAPAAGGGGGYPVLMEHDFTQSTSGDDFATDSTPIDIDTNGGGWVGTDLTSYTYDAGGGGADYPSNKRDWMGVDVGQEDVRVTVQFTDVQRGNQPAKWEGIALRCTGTGINEMLWVGVYGNSNTDANIGLLDYDTLHYEWDLSALIGDSIAEGDNIEIVASSVGAVITLDSVTINGTKHDIGVDYTLTDSPTSANTDHVGVGADIVGFGPTQDSGATDGVKTPYMKVEDLS